MDAGSSAPGIRAGGDGDGDLEIRRSLLAIHTAEERGLAGYMGLHEGRPEMLPATKCYGLYSSLQSRLSHPQMKPSNHGPTWQRDRADSASYPVPFA